MSESPILPALKANDWAGHPHALCHPLAVGLDTPHMPWVAYGYDHPHTFEFFTRDRIPNGGTPEQQQLIEHAALRNLRARRTGWEATELRKHFAKRLPILICSNDYLAAEHILDPEFMQQAHQRLKAKLLAVGVPRRGMMFAANAEQSQELLALFAAAIAAQFYQAESAPISPVVFVLRDGEIVGMARGMEETGRVIAEAYDAEDDTVAEAYSVTSKDTGRELLYIVLGGADPAKVGRAAVRTMVHSLQQLANNEDFGGEVVVLVSPERSPWGTARDRHLGELQDHLQGICSEINLQHGYQQPLLVRAFFANPPQVAQAPPAADLNGDGTLHQATAASSQMLPSPSGTRTGVWAGLRDWLRRGQR